MSKLNVIIDKDGEFEVVLRKEAVRTIVCNDGCYFRNKHTGEVSGSPMVVKGYLHDAEGNLLDSPEAPTIDDFEVIPYDR